MKPVHEEWLRLVRGLPKIAFRPTTAFSELGSAKARSFGVQAAILTGLLWAIFLAVLAYGGHQPSGPLLLSVPRADYYAWEAGMVIPVRLAMFFGMTHAVHALTIRAGGTGLRSETALICGGATAAATLLGWLLPDALAYAFLGFDSLALLVRWVAPVSTIWAIGLTAIGLVTLHAVSKGKATLIAIAGVVLYTLIGAPVLR